MNEIAESLCHINMGLAVCRQLLTSFWLARFSLPGMFRAADFPEMIAEAYRIEAQLVTLTHDIRCVAFALERLLPPPSFTSHEPG